MTWVTFTEQDPHAGEDAAYRAFAADQLGIPLRTLTADERAEIDEGLRKLEIVQAEERQEAEERERAFAERERREQAEADKSWERTAEEKREQLAQAEVAVARARIHVSEYDAVAAASRRGIERQEQEQARWVARGRMNRLNELPLQRFAALVADDPTCRFLALSYREHWQELEQLEQPPAFLAKHLEQLRRRYLVTV